MATHARKTPRQARSREMVARLVDATARVLERDGYQAASTNRIAFEAGVSPGSLYQYFGDKDELVAAVARRFIDQFANGLAPALRRASLQDPRSWSRTRMVIEAVVDVLDAQAPLLGTLVEGVSAVEQDIALRAVRARIADFVFQTLAARRDELRHDDLDRMTWTMVELVQQLTVRYVLDRPPITRRDFVEDTTRTLLMQAFDPLPHPSPDPVEHEHNR